MIHSAWYCENPRWAHLNAAAGCQTITAEWQWAMSKQYLGRRAQSQTLACSVSSLTRCRHKIFTRFYSHFFWGGGARWITEGSLSPLRRQSPYLPHQSRPAERCLLPRTSAINLLLSSSTSSLATENVLVNSFVAQLDGRAPPAVPAPEQHSNRTKTLQTGNELFLSEKNEKTSMHPGILASDGHKALLRRFTNRASTKSSKAVSV